MFDWQLSTLDECAWHIARTSAQSTTSMLRYYSSCGKTEVVEKIICARSLAKKYRTLIKAQDITEELVNKGMLIADYSEFQTKVVDK